MEDKLENYIKEVSNYFVFGKKKNVENNIRQEIAGAYEECKNRNELEKLLRNYGAPVEIAARYSDNQWIFSSSIILLEFYRVIKFLIPLTILTSFAIYFFIFDFQLFTNLNENLLKILLIVTIISFLVFLSTTIGFYLLDNESKYFNKDGEVEWEPYDL